ncbi:transposase [Teladorsagia circumcincta]|uniref:Transposase n=1 Tax=Teladorsagia circumcincta TaxID=45464 RepID=A0A2G9UTD9_TELCI|nr:transposase [Teladorsagia circumcincta]
MSNFAKLPDVAVHSHDKKDRRIVRLSLADPSLTCVDIAAKFNASDGLNISRRIVGRTLSAVGLNRRRPAKKPLIRFKNRKARVEFARAIFTGPQATGARSCLVTKASSTSSDQMVLSM